MKKGKRKFVRFLFGRGMEWFWKEGVGKEVVRDVIEKVVGGVGLGVSRGRNNLLRSLKEGIEICNLLG